MELSRTEYPGIVTSVSPVPAVKIIRDRIAKGNMLNQEIADWLQERRRVEEAYVQALNKLCKRPLPGESPDLGVFATPWHRIVEATASIADAHSQLANKIESEVERPIREFAIRNSEWTGMKALETNLGTVAKTIDVAEERAEKLKKRGAKAKAQQVADSAASVSSAYAEWDSQAPFVFEKFQVADEGRCNNLKDALTRLQTLELDRTQSSMKAVEETLAEMLDISTADEMKGFANKAIAGRQHLERRRSKASNHRAGQPSTPSIVTDDSVSVQSSHSGGGAISTASPGHGLGLKRLGTVLRGRNRHSMFHRSSSPDPRLGERKPSHSNLQSPKHSYSDANNLPLPSASLPAITDESLSHPASDSRPATSNGAESLSSPKSATFQRENSFGAPNSNRKPNGLEGTTSEAPKTDADGYSIPPPNHDHMPLGEPEAQPEEHQPQFKVEIKNEVIQEEDEDVDAAMSKVANTLRAANTVSRRVRGRRDARDVRNTMYVPSPPEQTESFASAASISPPLTPMKIPPRTPEAGSDTQSIRSARSIASLGAAIMKHPELHDSGLSSSLIECINATFEAGSPTKVQVTGEIALAYHSTDHESGSESAKIRLDNFAALEKVAPNPAFLSAVHGKPGEYIISLPNIRKTSVALKYQVHVDETNLASFPPIIVQTIWRIEPHQSSVILSWKPNPAFKLPPNHKGRLTLRNVAFVVGIEGAHASSCQSKPVGTFSREKGKIIWKLGDVTYDPRSTEDGGKMLARFATDAQAKAGPAEARWELINAETVGSGLGVSVEGEAPSAEEVESDPFADDAEKETADPAAASPSASWALVKTTRKVMSGRYVTI
ncbi:hypothetical protein EX30DRAFT_340630 [Ascodesmis nigricans]|uniref:MHD domain-containing protein n=1 Tax=Ascodesmis nigricans TaxID=341454 RepID=A0A4V3SIY3_9PEZI|nr:hypothetical protein EX30DRAFT_340630 [Ascodesmis nigricans]